MASNMNLPEPLESRTLFSTVVWTNRGGPGGSGSDTDHFNQYYKANAEAARAVVDTAINFWQQVIVDFNWEGGIDHFDLDLEAGPLDVGTRGETHGTHDDSDDTPYAADIVLDDDGGGQTWFFDPTPGLSEEFNPVDGDTSVGAPSLGMDMLRTTLHEMGHAFGFDEFADWFEADDLKIGNYLHDAGTDQVDNDGDLWVLIPPGYNSPLATFTTTGGLHVYEGPPDASSDYPAAPSTNNDLMNSGRTINNGTRELISDLDATILGASYGYTINPPSAIPALNYLSSFNPASGTLTVQGDLNSDKNDSVIIKRVGASIAVQVGLSQMLFDPSVVKQINLNLGSGDDVVTINEYDGNCFPDQGISLGGGTGDNGLYVFGPQLAASYTVSPAAVTVDTGAVTYNGVQHLYVVADSSSSFNSMSVMGTPSDLQDLHVFGSAGEDTIRVDAMDFNTALEVDALHGDDTLYMGFDDADLDDVDGLNIVINGGGDVDELTIFDQQNGFNNDYQVGPGDTSEGIFVRNTDLTVRFNGVEGLDFKAGYGQDDIAVTGTPADTSVKVDAGLGLDHVRVDSNGNQPGGTVDQVVRLLDLRGGPSAGDVLTVNDESDTAANDLYLTEEQIRSKAPGSFFGVGGGVDYVQFAEVNVTLGSGDDEFNLRSVKAGTKTHVNTGDGDDSLTLDSNGDAAGGTVNLIKGQVFFDGGTGQDDLSLQDASDATADVLTLTNMDAGAEASDTFFAPGGKLDFMGCESLAVDLGGGADAVNVRSIGVKTPVTINGGSGDDEITVDSNGTVAGGDVKWITNQLTVNGQADGARVTLENSGWLVNGDVVTVTANTAGADPGDKFFGWGGSLAYSGLNALTLNTSGVSDTAIVRSTAPGTVTNVNTGAGGDTVRINSVGSGPAGAADAVVSTLNVDGGSEANALVVDDAGDGTPDTVNVTSTNVAGCFGPAGTLNYANVAGLVLNLGPGSNVVNVLSTQPGTATVINSGAGADTINIDSNGEAAGGSVDNVQSPLTVNGQGGLNTLYLQDSSDATADVVTVNGTQVGAAPGNTFFGAGGSLSFSGIDNATLQLPSAVLGDTVYLTPSTATAFEIKGGNPVASPTSGGDSMVLNVAGLTNRRFTRLGKSAGRWEFNECRSVLFSDVEIVSSIG